MPRSRIRALTCPRFAPAEGRQRPATPQSPPLTGVVGEAERDVAAMLEHSPYLPQPLARMPASTLLQHPSTRSADWKNVGERNHFNASCDFFGAGNGSKYPERCNSPDGHGQGHGVLRGHRVIPKPMTLIRNWVGWGADLATRSPAVPQTRFQAGGARSALARQQSQAAWAKGVILASKPRFAS